MRNLPIALTSTVLLAALLSACGGGDDDPAPTPMDSIVTISAASTTALIGVYSSSTTGLSDVEKENPVGFPQFCSYRFNGLSKTGAQVLLDGRVAYNVNQDFVNNFKVSVSGVTYGSGSTEGTSIDKSGNMVTVTNKTLVSENDGVSIVVVTARVPMRGNRPDGC